MKQIIIIALLCAAASITSQAAAKTYTLNSPDGKVRASISADGKLIWSLDYAGKALVGKSELCMTLSDGTVLGSGKPSKAVTGKVSQTLKPVWYRKSLVDDTYNSLTLKYKSWSIEFRAYDDAFVWRFATLKRKPYTVNEDKVEFNFPEDWLAYVPYIHGSQKYEKAGLTAEQAYQKELRNNSFENTYSFVKLSGMSAKRLAFTPLMVERPDGVKLCILESDRRSYPGMYLINTDGSRTLRSYYAAYPKHMEQGGHINAQMLVKERGNFIARGDGSARTFPWRIVAISNEDRKMAANDVVYRLAAPSDPSEDWSWVKPGKVAWDWWNDWNIRGVDFKAGVNNDTYKHYIDFASANGIEYVILDEGWAVSGKCNLFDVIPEIDLKELVAYGESKNVGLILWAGYWAFAKEMDKVCSHYSKMGIKGYKVDFMNRDDQIVEEFLEEAAAICAKYRQVIDFHGIHAPTGLQRKYPNILNYEGVFGLEQLKFAGNADVDMVTFDVQIPFIRYVAGSADYTQGAMLNGTRKNFRPIYSEPMSQGTRCHQLAEYMVFDAPLNMLCDSPSNYMDNQECTSFIASIPTTWDETAVLDGKVGKYIVTARKKAGKWYIGALNGWEERDIEINLSAILGNNKALDCFCDGANADRSAKDYRHETLKTDARGCLKIHLAPGGGFAAISR